MTLMLHVCMYSRHAEFFEGPGCGHTRLALSVCEKFTAHYHGLGPMRGAGAMLGASMYQLFSSSQEVCEEDEDMEVSESSSHYCIFGLEAGLGFELELSFPIFDFVSQLTLSK